MQKQEISKLLTFISVVDKRTVGVTDVEVWAEILPSEIAYEDAMAAVKEHFQVSSGYLQPHDVISKAAKFAKARVVAAGTPDFPPNLSWRQERQWAAERNRQIQSGMSPEAATQAADRRFQIRRPELVSRPANVPNVLPAP